MELRDWSGSGSRWRGPGDVVPGASTHILELPDEVVQRRITPLEIELGGLDDQQRCGRVVIEEVVVCLVQLTQILIIRQRPFKVVPAPLSRSALNQVSGGLEIDHQIRGGHVRRKQVIEPLVDEQLVIVKVEIGVDLVLVEQVIGDRQLIEEVDLPKSRLLAVAGEQREQLGLERRTRMATVEIGHEWVVGLVQQHCRIEAVTKVLGKDGFAYANRTFDGDIAEVQDGPQYSSRRCVLLWRAGRMQTTPESRALLLRTLRTLAPSSGLSAALGVVAVAIACARTLPVAPPPLPTFGDKMGWILRLEDQRILRDVPPAPMSTASDTSSPLSGGVFLRPEPDLVELLADSEPQVRRRAALAIGRVGRPEGVAPLVGGLADPQAQVRQMAAFALGLIGDRSASAALVRALLDPSPIVQGRAAEALGRIGAIDAAPSIGALVKRHITSAFEVDPEDVSFPQAPEVEAFRLGLYALAELDGFAPLADAVLLENDQPILWWWPVAYALQRLEDPRALTALTTLAGVQGSIGVALAAEGLGALGDPAAVDTLVSLLDRERRDDLVVATAVRALARIDDTRATATLRRFVLTRDLDPTLLIEAVQALSGRPGADAMPIFVELMAHPWPPLRAAALWALAQADPETFMLVLSGSEPDADWRVRAATAQALEYVQPGAANARLTAMLADEDQRVVPSVLSALVAQEAPGVASVLLAHLQRDDVVVRKTAAQLLATVKPPEAEEALAAAYWAADTDPTYLARAAILEALAEIDGSLAREVLRAALDDKEWAVRVRAADVLSRLEPDEDHGARIRPAPRRQGLSYTAERLINPSVSPHVYLETDRGTVQIELAVLDAPQTTENFVMLAREGYYDGLTFHRVVYNYVVQGGDPRSDSEGGPGYTLRDELNQLPYLRGTLGMALDWEDTGGSQFFITHSPQPQLDGRYTVFGRVVDGMDVVNQLRQGDVIRRVLVWDGEEPLLP